MSSPDHKKSAKGLKANCAIIVITDTRKLDEDRSGKMARSILLRNGHVVSSYTLCGNNKSQIKRAIKSRQADLIITIGGTGISKKDLSSDVALSLIKKELPGFGELYRAMSYSKIKTAAILSRTVMGITLSGQVICSLPGSERAVRLAIEKILIKELPHIIWELRK